MAGLQDDRAARGRDRLFLARAFQKLLINFTWWVNRKDVTGKHLFAGGFLGLDNISLFDRSKQLPGGAVLEQADGTAWMAFYCVTMLAMALELAREDAAYEDVASKFFEHFVGIADAMNQLGGTGLWDEEDGFYYDKIQVNNRPLRLRIRSLVGIIPLFAVEILEDQTITRLPGFRKRLQWFLDNRRDLARHVSYLEAQGPRGHRGRAIIAVRRGREPHQSERPDRRGVAAQDQAGFLRAISSGGVAGAARFDALVRGISFAD